MRNKRAAEKLNKLRGEKPTPGAKADPVSVVVTPPLLVNPAGMTREEWARQLVALGSAWVNRSQELLASNPREAVHVAKAGVDLVNANIVFLPSDRDGEAQRGSLAVVDAKFLHDPVFREHATALLRRKREIMEASESASA